MFLDCLWAAVDHQRRLCSLFNGSYFYCGMPERCLERACRGVPATRLRRSDGWLIKPLTES